MKKAMAVLLAGVMTIGLTACGGKGDAEKSDSGKGGTSETYTISFNQNNGNTTDMPNYQFLGGDIAGFLGYEARLYDDITLVLNDDGTYELTSDMYTMQNEKRIEIGESDGVGMVVVLTAEGTYEENEDGTVTTSAATHAAFELETDVYSQEIVAAAGLAAVEGETSGKYDSDEVEALLDRVPETVFTLGEGGEIVSYAGTEGVE